MREERIRVGGRDLVVERPDDPELLLDERRFAQDEFMPYWAELWPSGIALARRVATLDLRACRVLELGCGLGLPSLVAAAQGAAVLATDWAPDALELLARNASRNGVTLETEALDWHTPLSPALDVFDLVLAADVLYEERNAAPLLEALEALVSGPGEALVADPGRRHAPPFLDAARRAGWSVRQEVVGDLPHGWLAVLRRREPPTALRPSG